MNKGAPQPNDLPGILAEVGDFNAWCTTDAGQAWCKQHFVALEPGAGAEQERAGPAVIDLEGLEVAQQQYREVRLMLAEALPLETWLKVRPPFVMVEQRGALIEALEATAREIEDQFGVMLIARPALSAQRRRPH